MTNKIGFDDYLCRHNVEDFKELPTHVIRYKTINEAITDITPETPFDEIGDILKRISATSFESEQSAYINKLSEKTGISKRDFKKDVKAFTGKEQAAVIEREITIAHPSYESNASFLSLGFRETVVVDGCRTEDKNLYLTSIDGRYELHSEAVVKRDSGCLLFDVRDRVLVGVNDKWSKRKLLEFVKNPRTPTGLYGEIRQVLQGYIEFERDGLYGLLAIWIIATYFHRSFNAMPFVFIYGKKGCGKSRLLDLLERLAFNAYKTKGVSVASLADSIDATRATFLNDQAESLSNPKNEEILGILTDSYTIGGGKRRIVNITNKSRKVVEFETYSPKAFASIKEIDSDLKDRCILFLMVRASRDYPYPEAHLPIWGELRDKLYRLALTRWSDALEIYQTTGEGVSHRVRELWKPLETVLKMESVPLKEQRDIMSVFLDSMQETQVELSENELKLFDVLLEMTVDGSCVCTTADIAKKIEKDDGISEKSMQTWIGRTIKQFSLFTEKKGRVKSKREYLFTSERIENILKRYQTGGIGGTDAAEPLQNKGLRSATYIQTGGTEVATGGTDMAIGGNIQTLPYGFGENLPPQEMIEGVEFAGNTLPPLPPLPPIPKNTKTGGTAVSPANKGVMDALPPLPPKTADFGNDTCSEKTVSSLSGVCPEGNFLRRHIEI